MLVRPRAVPPFGPFLGPSRETRLPWEEVGRGDPRDSVQAAVQLDTFAGGTFTRASEASYLTGAPTSGATAFLAWSVAGARRVENRGDGNGDMLLLEGARTNQLRVSEDYSTVWAKVNCSVISDVLPVPDTDADGDGPFTPTAANGTCRQTITAITDGQQVVTSGYFLDAAGQSIRLVLTGRDSVQNLSADLAVTPSGIWARRDFSANAGTGAASAIAGFFTSTAQHQIDRVWGMQCEAGAFWPSSYIRTAGVAVTRAAEVLTYAAGTYPGEFLTNGVRVPVAPDFSSAELIAAGAAGSACVLTFDAGGTSRALQLVNSAGSVFARITSPGGTDVSQGPITFSRGQLLTLSVVPGTCAITVAGATTGNGTATGAGGGAFAAGTLRVGSFISGAIGPFFGRTARFLEAL